MKKLSLVIATRNDSYNSEYTTPLFRLQKSLERTLHNAGDTNMEIIIVDYGSDEKLEDCLGIDDERLRFIYIDKEECAKYDTPFNEVKCINRGAKNATGDFIGRVDQDTIVGKRFFEWFNNDGNLSESEFYFSNRRDLELGDELEHDDAPCPYCRRLATGTRKTFWKGAVGILLIPRNAYHESRGYNEKYIHHNHMEHEFISRLEKRLSLINLGTKIDHPFYHLFHNTQDGLDTRVENKPWKDTNDAYAANSASWG